ncbi:MAG: hypothetical protein MK291_02290 [Planctomycetes bacterium]|nr:hypothetical protein [Planctomycetota bacterium]
MMQLEESDRTRVLAEMSGALRSELGARTAYASLAWRLSGTEVEGVLRRMHAEEDEAIEILCGLLKRAGVSPRRWSLRRWAAAWGLTFATYLTGARFALRTCGEAEEAVSRWYREFERIFAEVGDKESAEQFARLSRLKQLHAQTLDTWVENLPRAR